jgi:F0F1-type ATP synthase beta subunit
MPPIYQALRVTSEGFDVPHPINVVLEVEQHIGEGRVRCVAMESTEGMVRGMKCLDLGGQISVPVGVATPTGTVICEPVSMHFMPRTMPSVDSIATQRTRPSPMCCSTSKMTLMGRGTSKPSLITRSA